MTTRSTGRVRAQAGAALLAAVLTLAACGGSDDSGDGGDSAAATSGKADPDASLRLAFDVMPASMDPHVVAHDGETTFLRLVYDSVLMLDKNQVLQPGIAESWEMSEDAKTLSLTLREGATFHDGSDVDAEDVAASLERGKTLTGSTVTGNLANLASVEVVSPTELTLSLTNPDTTFPIQLTAAAGMVISSEAVEAGTSLTTDPAGAASGPYTVASFTPRESLSVTRWEEKHWDEAAGLAAEITLENVVDPEARLNGLRTGEYDMIRARQTMDVLQPLESAGFVIYGFDAASNVTLFLHNDTPLTDNAEARTAVAQAFDKEAAAGAASDDCSPITQIFPKGSDAHIEDYAPLEFSAKDAEAALGSVSDADLSVMFGSGTVREQRLAELLKQNLEDVGGSVTLNPVPTADTVAAFLANSNTGWIVGALGSADPVQYVERYYLNAPWNLLEGDPQRDVLQKVVTEAKGLPLGSPERAEVLQEMQRIALESAVLIPICQPEVRFAATEGVIGVEDMPFTWQALYDFRYLGKS
jgi:peptide/nickel transport system substrate-binding protein